jgi:hypothetical protein
MYMIKTRKVLLISLLLFFSIVASAQRSIDKLFEKYAENKEFRYVYISKGLINISDLLGKVSEDRTKDVLSRITGMRILTLNAPRRSAVAKAFFEDIDNAIKNTDYADVMEARDKGVYTRVLSKTDLKNTSDMLIISKSDTIQHFIWLKGKVNADDLQNVEKK